MFLRTTFAIGLGDPLEYYQLFMVNRFLLRKAIQNLFETLVRRYSMAFNVSVPARFLEGREELPAEPRTDHYINRQFHDKQAFARIENWYEDIKDFTFHTTFVPLTRDQAIMITRYYEGANWNCRSLIQQGLIKFSELRLRAAIRDQDRRESGEKVEEWNESLYDVDFRENFYTFVMDDWPEDWKQHLIEMRTKLDEAIARYASGAFVKLSNRSPKDAAMYTPFLRDYVRNALSTSTFQTGSIEAMNEDIAVFSRAGWLGNKCVVDCSFPLQ